MGSCVDQEGGWQRAVGVVTWNCGSCVTVMTAHHGPGGACVQGVGTMQHPPPLNLTGAGPCVEAALPFPLAVCGTSLLHVVGSAEQKEFPPPPPPPPSSPHPLPSRPLGGSPFSTTLQQQSNTVNDLSILSIL